MLKNNIMKKQQVGSSNTKSLNNTKIRLIILNLKKTKKHKIFLKMNIF